MDEDVTTANFLEEDALSCVVKEVGIVPGNETISVKNEAQGEVLNARFATTVALQDLW
jgi:hypothetical protein